MRTSDVVLVSFTTAAREDSEQYIPIFEANRNVTDEEVRQRQIEMKRASFIADMQDKPYFGELENVFMAVASDLDTTKCRVWNRDEHGSLLGPSIANQLLTWFPNRFDKDTGEVLGLPIRFVGFGIRQFVKLLATECAEDGNSVLPHCLWYGSDHREVRTMVIPNPEDGINMDVVLARLNIARFEGEAFEPGDDAIHDAMVAAECVRKMNVFPFTNVSLQRIARSLATQLNLEVPAEPAIVAPKALAGNKPAGKPTAKTRTVLKTNKKNGRGSKAKAK